MGANEYYGLAEVLVVDKVGVLAGDKVGVLVVDNVDALVVVDKVGVLVVDKWTTRSPLVRCARSPGSRSVSPFRDFMGMQ